MVNIDRVVAGMDSISGVIGAVRGLVRVFQQGRSLVRELRDATRSEDLSQSLTVGECHVQNDYDAHVSRIGRPFEFGDEIAVSELKDVIIVLQSQLIGVLLSSSTRWAGSLPLSQLMDISVTAQQNAIGTLTMLSIRLSPVPRSLTYGRPSQFFCRFGAEKLQSVSTNIPVEEVCGNHRKDECNYCWALSWPDFRVEGTSWILSKRFLHKSHIRMESTRNLLADLGCIFCDSPEVFTMAKDLAEHLKSFHYNDRYWMDKDIKVVT